MGKRGPQPTKRLPDAEAVEQSLIVRNEDALTSQDEIKNQKLKASLEARVERQERAQDKLSKELDQSVKVIKEAQCVGPLDEEEGRQWNVRLKAALSNLEMNGLRVKGGDNAPPQPVVINITHVQVERMTRAVQRLGAQ